MTQQNELTNPTIHRAALGKRMLQGAAIAFVLISLFLLSAGEPDPAWPKLWMLKPLLMVPAAFVGRLSWGSRLLPFGLVVLIGVQYATANSAVPAAAFHPVNALLIFWVGLLVVRRAWSAVAGRGKG